MHKCGTLVKGFIINGEDVPLHVGLTNRIKDLYCKPNTPNIAVRVARSL